MLIAIGAVFYGLAGAYLLAALRGGGSPGRAIAAAGWTALLTALPLGAAMYSWWWAGLERWELALGQVVVLGQAVFAYRFLGQPFHQAEPVVDPMLVRPLEEVAARAGLPKRPPLLRHRTLGALPAYAWVVRLQNPTVVVADGLVHRLTPPQVAAVLAHEVAHIASGSLWWLMLPAPLGATLALALMPWIGPFGALALALTLGLGLRRLVSRSTERLCDRLGAALSSAEAFREGLRRMHALHPMREGGWRGALAWGVAGHPHLSERLRALGGGATAEAERHARVSRMAFAGWGAAVLSGGLPLLLAGEAGEPVAVGIWVLTALALVFAARLGARSTLARQGRLVPRRLPGRWVMVAGWGLLLVGFALAALHLAPCVGLCCVLLGFVGMGFGELRARGVRRLRAGVGELLQGQDLEGAHRLGQASARALRRDPALRLDLALVALALGRREEGMAALEDLVQRAPRLVLAPLKLGSVLLGEAPERSLALGRLAVQRAPTEPLGWLLQVRALRRLDRSGEAQVAWKAAEALGIEDPGLPTQAAELALDRGDLEAARGWVAQARERGPGELDLLLVEARLALALGDRAAVAAWLGRAEALCADHPFVFADWRLAELRSALAGSATPEGPAPASRSG